MKFLILLPRELNDVGLSRCRTPKAEIFLIISQQKWPQNISAVSLHCACAHHRPDSAAYCSRCVTFVQTMPSVGRIPCGWCSLVGVWVRGARVRGGLALSACDVACFGWRFGVEYIWNEDNNDFLSQGACRGSGSFVIGSIYLREYFAYMYTYSYFVFLISSHYHHSLHPCFMTFHCSADHCLAKCLPLTSTR